MKHQMYSYYYPAYCTVEPLQEELPLSRPTSALARLRAIRNRVGVCCSRTAVHNRVTRVTTQQARCRDMKKTYTIRHEETLVGYFDVEAETAEDALEEYNRLVSEGKIDFSDLEMSDSSDTAYKINGRLIKRPVQILREGIRKGDQPFLSWFCPCGAEVMKHQSYCGKCNAPLLFE